jgi:hypothetical protein
MKGFQPDTPREEPRPLFLTLPAAVRTAVAHGTTLDDINKARWADSYPPATEADVEREFLSAMTKSLNSGCIGDGK